MKCVLAAVLIAVPAVAAEYVVLTTGFRLHAERYESDGAVLRLYLGGGITEIPVEHVLRIEAGEPLPLPEATVEASAPEQPPDLRDMVTRAALRHGLPPELVHSVAQVESGYRADAVSPKGAIGVMQLMPSTAEMLQANPSDPEQNIEAGAKHLRELLLRYQHDLYQVRKALAGYNAGSGAVDRYRGIPPYAETQLYVEKVIERYNRLRSSPEGLRSDQ